MVLGTQAYEVGLELVELVSGDRGKIKNRDGCLEHISVMQHLKCER